MPQAAKYLTVVKMVDSARLASFIDSFLPELIDATTLLPESRQANPFAAALWKSEVSWLLMVSTAFFQPLYPFCTNAFFAPSACEVFGSKIPKVVASLQVAQNAMPLLWSYSSHGNLSNQECRNLRACFLGNAMGWFTSEATKP